MPDAGYPFPTFLQTTLGIVAFFFPLMLYAAWATLAFADLGKRDDTSRGVRMAWIAAILLLPWLGAAAYHAVGRSTVAGPVRVMMLLGGIAVWALLLMVGSLVGGIS